MKLLFLTNSLQKFDRERVKLIFEQYLLCEVCKVKFSSTCNLKCVHFNSLHDVLDLGLF